MIALDFETYSSMPLAKAGVYKYVLSPDFEILLCAYSVDGGPVICLDLHLPEQARFFDTHFRQMLLGHGHLLHAHNATFEALCIARHYGLAITPDYAAKFRCSMLHGLYCGYPASLEAIGKALDMPQDKQKLASGNALIRYFCSPCAPTKANGGRTRNLPRHDPAKWELFKDYCTGDVIAEMELLRRLSNFPVPDEIQRQWQTDFIINGRGIAADMELVRAAIQIGDGNRLQLMDEAAALTGLQNPNSLTQLAPWLGAELGEELGDLRKGTVGRLLDGAIASGAARRMLEIRQELGKTSMAKYNAIDAAICADGRVRGLLQFYGANRTGRWAGRLLQVQNLPQTHLRALPLARNAAKQMDAAKLRVLYGRVPDTLSQLIRTALIATPGHVFIDADFSSIEARVLAWLAGEAWKLDVFRTHGKIYEASASMMFGVPIENIKKGNPEYALRQRGKVAELGLGYGMGADKFKETAERSYGMAFAADEAQDIVDRWRGANKRICDLWHSVGVAAMSAVRKGMPTSIKGLTFARESDPGNDLDFMTVRLPSSRKLHYARPAMGKNRWGQPSIVFYGMNQTTKKWTLVETFGAKLVENIVQAIARDCLAEAIERLTAAGYDIVMHVHDEVVIDCPAERADLGAVAAIMSRPMPWAPDLPLGADGWIGDYYRKD
jgi:DNA polymerase